LPLSRLSLYGNPNIGAFTFATDKFALIPPDMPPSGIKEFSSALDVPVHMATVGSSVLLGIFIIGNSNGLILPGIVTEEEYLAIEENVSVPLAIYNGKKNALGNMILTTDNDALIAPEADPVLKELVASHLKVKLHEGKIATLNMPGVCGVANSKGLVVHPLTTDEELHNLEQIFNTPVDISTVNRGFPYLRVGMTANSKGVVVGDATTGPEMVRIESSLGLTG
jgi:translation initiation factor 6